MSNAIDLAIPVPQNRGGTSATSYGANQVIFQNAGNTAFSSSSSLVYSTNLSLTGGAYSCGFADGDKFLLVGSANAAKIAHAAPWVFQSYAGALTSAGGGPNTGLFSWHTVGAAGTSFQQVMGLSNSGVLNLPILTAGPNKPVFTDLSKNLVSTGIVPIVNGGTNTLSQTNNGVNFFNGTSITSGSNFYFASNALTLSNTGTVTAPTATTAFNIFSNTQASARIVFSGQEFFQAANTSTDGLAALLGMNRTSNRQLWLADSALTVQNTTNPVLRLGILGAGTAAFIDSAATNGTTILPIQFGNNGALTTLAGSALNVPSLTASSFVFTDGSKNLASTGTAILSVTNGGTGTSTTFTQGSVVFAGASGIYNQNNDGFFWDNTNARLSVGLVSPGTLGVISIAALEVRTGSGFNSIDLMQTWVRPRSSTGGSTQGLILLGTGATTSGAIGINDYGAIFMGNNPAIVTNPQQARAAIFQLRIGGSASTSSTNGIFLQATCTDTNTGIFTQFFANNASTEAMRIEPAANLLIGTTSNTAAARLNVQGSAANLVLFQTTATATFVPVLTSLAPNITAQTVTHDIGTAIRTLGPTFNLGYIGFNSVTAGSSSNTLVLGIYNTGAISDNLLTLATNGDTTVNLGNLIIDTATKGLQVKRTAVSAGTANGTFVTNVVLVAGTVTINDSTVTTNHVGFATRVVNGGTVGSYRVTCAAGSFTVLSSSGTDTSTLAVMLILAT